MDKDKTKFKIVYAAVKTTLEGTEEIKGNLNFYKDPTCDLDLFFNHLGAALIKRQEIKSQNDCRMILIHFMTQMSKGANEQIKINAERGVDK
jgi:hypothetical protein